MSLYEQLKLQINISSHSFFCVTHLNERLIIIRVFVFLGDENHLIIHEGND